MIILQRIEILQKEGIVLKEKSNSLQYRRVDKAILTAFVYLSGRMPFEKITVQDILDEALVSRYTFYAHFQDKYAVAERLQNDVYQEFQKFMKKTIPEIDAKQATWEQHHQMIDAAAMAFGQAYHTQVQALKKIHTETVDFEKRIKEYFASNYRHSCATHPHVELEAEIYSSMAAAVMEYYSGRSVPEKIDNEAVMHAYANTAVYALGIHDSKQAEKTVTYLLKIARKIEQ